MQTHAGDLGQYDVIVDGQVVARRKRSVLNTLLKSGWPSADEVLRGIENQIAGHRAGAS